MQNFIEGEIIKYEREQTFIDIYLFVGKIIRFKNSSPVKYFFFLFILIYDKLMYMYIYCQYRKISIQMR